MLVSLRSAAALHYQGVALALTIAACAQFLSEHYSGPAMLFALLIGMTFNFLIEDGRCAVGVEFASKTLLRIGVALLGFRLGFSDIATLGLKPVLAVVALVTFTILAGVAIAPLLGRRWRFGLLTGGSVAICGASAALAIAAVLPKRGDLERDTLFTVVAVTTLSTIAMVVYPAVFRALDLSDVKVGFLIGATIHDVAQVVGAGFSVSDTTGNIATYVKLQRVAMLPLVLIAVPLFAHDGVRKGVSLPWFVLAFVGFVVLNNSGLVGQGLRSVAGDVSQWLLLIAISALGVKTSLKTMSAVGARHAFVIVCETLLLLGGALMFVRYGFE